MTQTLQKTNERLNRRALLTAGALAPAALALGGPARATTMAEGDAFTYEVVRSDAEWKEMLSDIEFFVMREGGTEPRHTSLLAFEKRPGSYACRGCDLPAFDADWKVPHPDIGWVFFSQARPDTILTGIDENFGTMEGEEPAPGATIECHCRRCGSHFGHILNVRDEVLHCLNGTSLVFSPM
jgi:peptide-methionine (R)-S-oxide reductase